jgi:hypothetical protein
MRHPAPWASALALALLVAACAAPLPSQTLGPNEYWLPVDPGLGLGPGATPLACAGVGVDATLAGDPADPRKVWLQDAALGGRIDLVWSPGYRVRFSRGIASEFTVVDANGRAIIAGGSHVSGACIANDNVDWLDTALPR